MTPAHLLAVASLMSVLLLASCGGGDDVSSSEKDRAVKEAQAIFDSVQQNRGDLGRGPCIAERLPGLPDWVVDVAHDPRQPVDDIPANQCARYRDGKAHHFVELDPGGNLIRAQ